MVNPNTRTPHTTTLEDARKRVDSSAADPLGRLKLLIALDALLVEGSVGRAAEKMGIGSPAMSRILAQIRETYDDPILMRRGGSMVPTPFAEQLRPRLRALAAEASALLDAPAASIGGGSSTIATSTRLPILKAPPLAIRQTVNLADGPTPEEMARRLAEIANDSNPRRRLAKHIATIGAGAGRSRPLTMEEARDAMEIVLDGEADPIQIGALLVAMNYRGLTAPELAGLAQAARNQAGIATGGAREIDLDWPAYMSPRRGGPPWFLLSARLVGSAGKKVLLHGLGEEATNLGKGLKFLQVPVCASREEANARLRAGNVAYLPLGAISTQLHALTGTYSLFEMRSPINLMVHLLNPLQARCSLLGVPAQPYRETFRDAAALLGLRNVTIITDARDVAQFSPFSTTELIELEDGSPMETIIRSVPKPASHAKTGLNTMEFWRAVWEDAARDEQGVQVVLATTAAALRRIEGTKLSWDEALFWARNLWDNRL